MLRWIGRWILATIVVAAILLIPVSMGAGMYFRTRRDPGWGVRPETFPIAVWSENRVNLVHQRELRDFLTKHPDSTFLIPKNKGVEVADRPDGSQLIHFRDSQYDDIDNESWYIAHPKSIEPQYHREMLDLGYGMAVTFTTFAILGIAAPLLGLVFVVWRRHRASATLAGP